MGMLAPMFTLRPALPSDAAFLAQLEHEVMSPHAKALWGSMVQPELSGFDLGNTRIVEVNSTPVGYLTVEYALDHLRLRKLYLVPKAQGRGLGCRLLACVQAEAEQRGLPLRLSVLRPNSRALAFYLREGLEIAETTPDRIFLKTRTGTMDQRTAL
jgi:GNAT superfamily N-acetyltransferase